MPLAGQPFANRFSRFRRRDSSGRGEVRREPSSGADGHVQFAGERRKSLNISITADQNFHIVPLQIEQVAQLATFSEALLEYHQQCTEVLRGLTETLLEKYVCNANHDTEFHDIEIYSQCVIFFFLTLIQKFFWIIAYSFYVNAFFF